MEEKNICPNCEELKIEIGRLKGIIAQLEKDLGIREEKRIEIEETFIENIRKNYPHVTF